MNKRALTVSLCDHIFYSFCELCVLQVKRGLEDRWMPIKTDEFEGSGGVYFLTSSGGQRTAVFKPQDEEQGMPQNPKYYVRAFFCTSCISAVQQYFTPASS